MQDKILAEFERVGIRAVKKGKMEELEKFLNKIVESEAGSE